MEVTHAPMLTMRDLDPGVHAKVCELAAATGGLWRPRHV